MEVLGGGNVVELVGEVVEGAVDGGGEGVGGEVEGGEGFGEVAYLGLPVRVGVAIAGGGVVVVLIVEDVVVLGVVEGVGAEVGWEVALDGGAGRVARHLIGHKLEDAIVIGILVREDEGGGIPRHIIAKLNTYSARHGGRVVVVGGAVVGVDGVVVGFAGGHHGTHYEG